MIVTFVVSKEIILTGVVQGSSLAPSKTDEPENKLKHFNHILHFLNYYKLLQMSIAHHGNPSQSYGASPAIRDRTVLPDRYKCAPPQSQPGRPVLNLPTPKG